MANFTVSSLLLVVVVALCATWVCGEDSTDVTGPFAAQVLTDENAMIAIASHKVMICLFYKPGERLIADQKVVGDGKGGDLLKEMDTLAATGRGKSLWTTHSLSLTHIMSDGVAIVNVEQFPLIAKIYKVDLHSTPTLKLFRDAKPGDYSGVRVASAMHGFLETMFNPAFDGFF